MASKFPASFQYSISLATLVITLSFLISSIHAHDHHELSTSPHSNPFEFLRKLEGIKKGDQNKSIIDLKKYLQRFGYIINPKKTLNKYQTCSIENHRSAENGSVVISPNHHDDDNFDDRLETAIKTYQINYNLEPTGTIDSKTLTKMMTPRCGVPDFANGKTRMKSNPERSSSLKSKNKLHRKLPNYTFFTGEPKWPPNKRVLSYGFKAGIPLAAVEAVGRAFKTWAANAPFEFTLAGDGQPSDIQLSFEVGDHGDGGPFDGRGGTLAHAFAPMDGRLHFDAEDSWSIGAVRGAHDIETTALHEIGHILGLQHSSVEDAIMWPLINSGSTKGLNQDDISGISDLYN